MTDHTADDSLTVRIVEGLALRPGDRLVIRVNPQNRDDLQDFSRAVRRALPGVTVIVLAVDQMAVVPSPALDDPARRLVDPALCDVLVRRAMEDTQPCGLETPCPRHTFDHPRWHP